MANAKTKDFELFQTITANNAGASASIDLNSFVEVSDMEAFGLEGVEVSIDTTETTPSTSEYRLQIAIEDLGTGFISHADYNSLYLTNVDVTTGYNHESLSLGDVKQIRYVPGGTLYMRAQRIGASDVDLCVRLTGKISKLNAKDYMALALTKASN